MVSLFLPLCWNLIPIEILWSFPLFDESCDCFSWNPLEHRTYPIQTIAPYYFSFVLCPLFIYTRGLAPEMKVGKINLWTMHFIYTSIQALDLFIAVLQIPYYRTFFVFTGIILHVKLLLDETDNNR